MLMNYDISIYNRMPKPQAPKSKPQRKDHPDPHHTHQTEREMRTRIERETRERGDREHRQPPKHHVQQHDDHDDNYTDDKDPHEIKRHRDRENIEMEKMLARRHAERDEERLERHKTAREGLLEEAYKDVPDDARRAMIEARRRRAKEMMEADEELGMIEKVRMDRNKRLDKVHEGRMAGLEEMGAHASLVAAKTKEEEARKLAEHEQHTKATQLIEDVLLMVRANKVSMEGDRSFFKCCLKYAYDDTVKMLLLIIERAAGCNFFKNNLLALYSGQNSLGCHPSRG